MRTFGWLIGMTVLCACSGADFDVVVANQGPATERSSVGAFLHVHDGDGQSLRSSGGGLEVEVETRRPDAAWEPAAWVTVEDPTPPLIDTVLVADNSGSEADYIQEIKDAVADFAHVILTREHPDRVGLVRVSTEASVLQPLTESEDELLAAADTMYVNRGWTALWDGVRLANETLAADAWEHTDTGICVDRAFRSIVVFTDAMDNNSADEQETAYSGDGVDTTFEELLILDVLASSTPVHTVAVGQTVDLDLLDELATETGGLHKGIRNFKGLTGALHGSAAQLDEATPFCFAPAACDDTEARVTVWVEFRGATRARSFDLAIDPTCD